MNKRVLANSLSGTSLYFVNIVVAFIMAPVLIHTLGNRDYGLWELVMSVIGYMGLLDLGIGTALVRFVSFADGKNDPVDMQQTISTSFFFFGALGFVAVSFFLFFSLYPQLIAGPDIKDVANLRTVFLLLSINAIFLFPLQTFVATLMGVQRHFFINNVRIVLLVTQASLTYYLLQLYPDHGLVVLALLLPFFTALQFVLFAKNIDNDGCFQVAESKCSSYHRQCNRTKFHSIFCYT